MARLAALSFMATALLVTPAWATECAGDGSDSILKVAAWDIAVHQDKDGIPLAHLNIELANVSGRGLTLIDGVVVFTDSLGRYISLVGMEDAQNIAASGSLKWSGEYGGLRLNEVPAIGEANVTATACVRAVQYEDGTQERFTH